MRIAESELILNPDGSIYHLHLRPEQLANTVITVGDPDRVSNVTKYFDTIEFTSQKREFKTETGQYKGKRITVISTGIGTDNIDIVFNELDALVNIDLEKRIVKDQKTQLDIVRIGTSGSIQADIPVDSFVVSEMGIGFDSLLHFYQSEHLQNPGITDALKSHLDWFSRKSDPYAVMGDRTLFNLFSSKKTHPGVTVTNCGFYGPQGRVLRLPLQDDKLNNKLASFGFKGRKITNFEMETAAMYGMAKLLGHRAISMNAIIANRANGTFSSNPKKTVDSLIRYTLNRLVQ